MRACFLLRNSISLSNTILRCWFTILYWLSSTSHFCLERNSRSYNIKWLNKRIWTNKTYFVISFLFEWYWNCIACFFWKNNNSKNLKNSHLTSMLACFLSVKFRKCVHWNRLNLEDKAYFSKNLICFAKVSYSSCHFYHWDQWFKRLKKLITNFYPSHPVRFRKLY